MRSEPVVRELLGETHGTPSPRALARTALAVTAVVGLIALRRPDALTNPQFWAEDGMVWYAQAYQHGALRALLTPWTAYAQTFSRLAAAASLQVDLAHAPLVFNVAAIAVQALAPLYLLSGRFASLIPDRRVRALAALLWIGAPNGFEIQSNVTNAQTHLALLSLLVVIADVAPTRAWAAFDVGALLLAGLSGPTCVLLVPVAALAWWRGREPYRLLLLATVLVPAALQALTYVSTGGAGRVDTPLGATPLRCAQIIGGQIVVAGTLGARSYAALVDLGLSWTGGATALAGVAGLAFVVRALVVSRSRALRLFVLFATLVLGAALASPVLSAVPRWEGLRLPNVGGRYFAPVVLAWLAALLWSACADPSPRARLVARAVLAAALLVGLPLDWRVPPQPDLDFAAHAARFDAAPRGKTIVIPIPPAGWQMTLVKR